jgi:MFS family permease
MTNLDRSSGIEPMAPPAASRGFYYGWIVVALTVVSSLLVFGIRSAPSVLIKPLESEFAWTRSELSAAIAVGLIFTGIAAPFGGMLMDRVGPRRVLLGCLVLIGSSVALASQMSSYLQMMLLWGVMNGIGTGAVSVLGATVANRWFIARRGLVQGMLGAGTSAGMLVFIPLLSWLVVELGWRQASVIMGLIAFTLMPPVLLLMRDRPAEVGLYPYGAPADFVPSVAPLPSVRAVMDRAIRVPEFWLLTGSFFICGATSNGIIGTHFIPHAVDHGFSEVTAASVLAIMGSMNFVGTLFSGWLTDRYDPRKLLAVYYSLRGVSLFILPFVTEFSGLTIFAIIFGLDYIATVPPTIALCADVFGRVNVGTIYGFVFCAHQFGAAIAAQAGGVVHDVLGDYNAAFLSAGALAVIGGLMALRIDRTPLPEPGPQVAVP